MMAAVETLSGVIASEGERPRFGEGDAVVIRRRFPVGHFRVPNFVRGKRGTVEAVIYPPAVDNEEEAYGRNAGKRRHYYRIAIPMTEIWAEYKGSALDGLRIEVFETWLEGARNESTCA